MWAYFLENKIKNELKWLNRDTFVNTDITWSDVRLTLNLYMALFKHLMDTF